MPKILVPFAYQSWRYSIESSKMIKEPWFCPILAIIAIVVIIVFHPHKAFQKSRRIEAAVCCMKIWSESGYTLANCEILSDQRCLCFCRNHCSFSTISVQSHLFWSLSGHVADGPIGSTRSFLSLHCPGEGIYSRVRCSHSFWTTKKPWHQGMCKWNTG